jgi:hypothetical protein
MAIWGVCKKIIRLGVAIKMRFFFKKNDFLFADKENCITFALTNEMAA